MWVRRGVWEDDEDGNGARQDCRAYGEDEPGGDAWLIAECEDALRAYGDGMGSVLPLEAEFALLCLETGYTRSAGTIAEEDARFVRVLRAAARERERRRAKAEAKA